MKVSTKASLYLVLATFLWGITYPVTRNVLKTVDPFVFVNVRFAFATMAIFPSVWGLFYKTTQFILLGSLLIGVLNTLAYLCQTIGLETVNSARAAFITGTSIILVPLLSPLFKLGKPNGLDLLCALIGLIGLAILMNIRHLHIAHGDLWVLSGAISFSLQILYLQRLTQKIADYKLLAFYQIFFTVPLTLPFTKESLFKTAFSLQAIAGLLFCAVFATSFAYYLQNKYQKFTTAPKAALIFALEPVFASLLGVFINHETLTKNTLYGGLLLLFSLALPSLVHFKEPPLN